MRDPVHLGLDGKWYCYRENYDEEDRAGPFTRKTEAERWYRGYCDRLNNNDEWHE